jgi:hypothetical protein
MKERWRAILLALCICAIAALLIVRWGGRRTASSSAFNTDDPQTWLHRASQYLLDQDPGWGSTKAEYDEELGSFQIDGEGLITFEDGGWVYVVCHPGHDFDIAMAMASSRELYWCEAHGCPHVSIDAPRDRMLRDMNEFIKRYVHVKHEWKSKAVTSWQVYHPDKPPDYRPGMTMKPEGSGPRTPPGTSSRLRQLLHILQQPVAAQPTVQAIETRTRCIDGQWRA